jgi:hypothetical protein
MRCLGRSKKQLRPPLWQSALFLLPLSDSKSWTILLQNRLPYLHLYPLVSIIHRSRVYSNAHQFGLGLRPYYPLRCSVIIRIFRVNLFLGHHDLCCCALLRLSSSCVYMSPCAPALRLRFHLRSAFIASRIYSRSSLSPNSLITQSRFISLA